MKITKWFIHFGVPGYYERTHIMLTDGESYLAMMESLQTGQYSAWWAVMDG